MKRRKRAKYVKKTKIDYPHAQTLRTVSIFASKMNRRRSLSQRAADFLTRFFGSMWFLLANAAFFVLWFLINTGILPLFPAFDHFPFFFLTTGVSLEAILLSITVLISENRAARVAELREEIDFQVNVQAEREITKILTMLDEIRKELKIGPKHDPELQNMKRTIDVEKLGEEIEEEMG